MNTPLPRKAVNSDSIRMGIGFFRLEANGRGLDLVPKLVPIMWAAIVALVVLGGGWLLLRAFVQ